MSALYFDARIDGTQLTKDIANINKQIGQISAHMEKEGREIDAITSRIGAGLAGAFSVFTAGNFIKEMANVRGEFQQLEIAFETMLGSKEKADKLMAEVVQFAAKTPFELSEVASGSKQLLAFGVEAERVIPTLKAMGDVSAGLSVPIERLINNFGQVKTQMKLTGRELRDFQMAGVPIVAELAKNMNVAETAIADMVSTGKIGFKEVEEAFISMTSEGGRFSSLMEKQAESITGLASNFADAWDRMLNSIGQENEGIIAGSIKGAITLVENYEDVLKILKLLIATYGTYKAAVIATAVVERTAAAAGNIKAWFELARGIRSAKDAQIAFNLASKANPYALIAGAIASLISYLVIFRKETKDTQDYIDDLNNSIEGIGKQIEVDNLISKYTTLQNNTKRTKTEQEELNKTIRELGGIFPGVITQTDQYGNAIDLAKDKLIELNEELRENSKLATEKNILDAQDLLNRKIEERKKLLDEANSGLRYATDLEVVTGKARTGYDKVGLTVEEIEERRAKVEELNLEISKISESVSESEDKLQALGQINTAQVLQPYKELFGEVEKYSEEQALKIKEELTKLLFLGLGTEAEKQIKAEIDKIASQLALPTIQEQIQQVVSDLKQAQAQLDNLRAPGSRATTEQIKDKEDEIKALQAKYDALTGINRKEAEKRLEEERKAREERLKAISAFNDMELSLERQLQASKIAIMQQGTERRRAEAELEYQQELDRIRQQQQAYVDAWNETKGYKPGDAGFISELPKEEIEQFNQLRINAEERKNQRIETINRETANEIKAIWKDVNDVYLSDSERNIQAINERYDNLIKQAKKAGETDFASINEARAKAIEEAMIDSGLKLLQFEEEIELQRAEISTQGYNREVETEKKKLEIVKKFAQQKIEILKKSGTEQSKQEIEELKLLIDASDQGLKDINQRTLTESIQKTEQWINEFKKLTDEIFGADTRLSAVMSGMGDIAQGFARISGGDYSGALSVITSLYKMVNDTSATEKRLAQPWEEFEKWIAASNRELQRYIELRDEAIGYDRYDSSNEAIEQIKENIAEAQEQLLNLDLSFTFTGKGSGLFNAVKKAQKDLEKQVQELLEQLGGGIIELEKQTMNTWLGGAQTKGIFSYDLSQLLLGEDGKFTIQKINELIKESVITDQKVIEAVDYYESLIIQLSSAEKQKQELLTATMADNIADGIIDGFKQGYRSAADFAEGFEELMKDAIFNALKIQTLEEPLQEWYRQFAAASESDGMLTSQEIIELEGAYNNIIENARQQFDEMKRLANIDFSNDIAGREGLTGAIKGITEDTASVIAGQFFAFRELQHKTYLTGIEQLDAINQSVTHLAEIANNTKHNKHLTEIRDDIKNMSVYLKNLM